VTLAELAGFFADPQAQEDMRRRALSMAQSGARGFTTGLLGAPVDLANMAMGGAGGERPVMGSEWVGDKLSGMGLLSGRPEGAGQTLAELGGGLLNPGGALKAAAVKGPALAAMLVGTKHAPLDYYGAPGAREIAHGLRKGDAKSIEQAAETMAGGVPEGAVLVPIPGRDGSAGHTRALAEAISRRTGSPVADVLSGKARRSQYDAKKAGGGLSDDELEMFARDVPDGRILLIDNVTDTGATMRAAQRAIPNGVPMAFAEVRKRPTN
jgi:hypothetical protein